MLGARLRFIPRRRMLDRPETGALIGSSSDEVGLSVHLGQKPHQPRRLGPSKKPRPRRTLFQIQITACDLVLLHHTVAPGYGQYEQPLSCFYSHD